MVNRGSAAFRTVPRGDLSTADPRARPTETPKPGHYAKTTPPYDPDAGKTTGKGKKKDGADPIKENLKLKIDTSFGRGNLNSTGHYYHAMLRGYVPPPPIKGRLDEKQLARQAAATAMVKERESKSASVLGMMSLAPFPRPTLAEDPVGKMMADSVQGKWDAINAGQLAYTVTNETYYKTVARAPCTYTTERNQGRDTELKRDWIKGVDGAPSFESCEKIKRYVSKTQAINMNKVSGRDSNVGLPAPKEDTPDTFYDSAEAWKKQGTANSDPNDVTLTACITVTVTLTACITVTLTLTDPNDVPPSAPKGLRGFLKETTGGLPQTGINRDANTDSRLLRIGISSQLSSRWTGRTGCPSVRGITPTRPDTAITSRS